MTCIVDIDHERHKVIIMLNNAPLYWLYKRQKTGKTSTLRSEFLVLRAVTKTIIGMRYKLRAMALQYFL